MRAPSDENRPNRVAEGDAVEAKAQRLLLNGNTCQAKNRLPAQGPTRPELKYQVLLSPI